MAQNDFENKRDSADQKIDLRLWKRLIAYAMRHRRTVVSVMLVLLVVAGIDLAYPQLSRYAIDHFIEGGTTDGKKNRVSTIIAPRTKEAAEPRNQGARLSPATNLTAPK